MTQLFTPRDGCQLWFVGDTHFGHRAMAHDWRAGKFPCLGGNLIEDMDLELLYQWNTHVSPSDIVFHLGDVSFQPAGALLETLSSLNGEIHLIKGNHDVKRLNTAHKARFASINEYLEIDVQTEIGTKQRIVMCHYAFRSWNRMHFGSWNIHGHSHGNLMFSFGKQLDVGVDCTLIAPELRPLRYSEIEDYMQARQFEPTDHHTEKGDYK